MRSEVKALLLAAGYGTRLKPITDETPKCLIEIGGLTMLGRWIKKLEEISCTEAIVNTHYLANKVSNFLSSYGGLSFPVIQRYENELLGTAGTLLANKEFFRDSTVIMVHVDHISDVSLT